jgi:DNA-directed RNA polymerase specialized sigma24 family protein
MTTVHPKTAEALTLLAKHHKEYVNTVKSLYGNNFSVMNYAEDFVQNAYLKLSRYDNLFDKVVKPDGTVSKGYMFFCLRSIVINQLKKKRVVKYSYEGDMFDVEQKFIGMEHEGISGIDVIIEQDRDPVDEAIDTLEEKMYSIAKAGSKWFDYKLFETYMQTGKSFRTLAKETGLGIQTIYLSIKQTKILIAESLFEDYQDLINGDLELIKLK